MGLFSSTTTSEPHPPPPEPSKDGGYIAPSRTARASCWAGRDAFFACLDSHNIIDSVKDDATARQKCSPELRGFEEACASSWVTYFKKRRVMEWQRDQTLRKLDAEGAVAVDGSGVSAGALRK